MGEREILERMGLRLKTCVMSSFIHVFSSATVCLYSAKAHQITRVWIGLGLAYLLQIMGTLAFYVVIIV